QSCATRFGRRERNSTARRVDAMKNINEFLAPPALSCKREGPHDRIVMSSRVRLARNLKGFSFPGWAKKADRVKALEVVRPAVESLPQMAAAFSETMDNLSAMDKQILVEQINQIIQAVNKLGLAVRGLYGEGTEALGNVFQVSNQMTLGEAETDIVERLNKVLTQLIEHEENARGTLLEKKPKMVFNQI